MNETIFSKIAREIAINKIAQTRATSKSKATLGDLEFANQEREANIGSATSRAKEDWDVGAGSKFKVPPPPAETVATSIVDTTPPEKIAREKIAGVNSMDALSDLASILRTRPQRHVTPPEEIAKFNAKLLADREAAKAKKTRETPSAPIVGRPIDMRN